jgi:flagellar biosynthesis chaperone FliJ
MADSGKKAPDAPEAQIKLRAQLLSWARSAAPAVLSGLGLSGLVSILGAAVLWSRFNSAGLPASEAVSDLPTGTLIVTGAASLVFYLVLGLGAVLTVYLFQGGVLSHVLEHGRSADPVGHLRHQAHLTLSRVTELEGDLDKARKSSTAEQKVLDQLEKEAAAAGTAVAEAVEDGVKGAELAHLQSAERQRQTAVTEAEGPLKDAKARIEGIQKELRARTRRSDELGCRLFQAKSLRLTVAPYGTWPALAVLVALELAVVVARTTASWWEKGGLWGGLLLLVLLLLLALPAPRTDAPEQLPKGSPMRSVSLVVAGLVAFVVAWRVDPWICAPVAASLVLALCCFAIGRLHPRRFFWLGISIFASVALFGAVLTYSRDLNAPSAQGAAVLLKNGCAVQGLWIGESSKRVFLARVDPDAAKPGDGRIFSLESSQVVSSSIGKLVRVGDANGQAGALRMELLNAQSETDLTKQDCTASGRTSDYFAGSMSSFKGPATLHAEALPRPMCLVRYFDQQSAKAKDGDPGANWWTTCEYDERALGSKALVRSKLALPKAWGARNARVTATIPAGTKISYLMGAANRQCEDSGAVCYEGGGTQLLFHDRDVNRAWLGQIECDRSAEQAVQYRFAACEL